MQLSHLYKDLIFFYLTHTAHVLKRGLCDVTQVEENVFEDSFELCFMTANCTNQILLISLMRMKNSQQMEFFGKWYVHDVNLMDIDDVIIYHLWYCTIVWSAWKTIKNLVLNFLWLLISYTVAIRWWEYRREILYVVYRCLNFNCYLQFWVDTNVLLCWFCGPCWCFDEDAFVQSTHIYLWIKFIKLHSASKAFREYRIGL